MEKIVVLGGGESGCGAAILARVEGFDVFLSDAGPLAPKYRSLLDVWGVPYEEGHHTEAKIMQATEVIKSPGIPDQAPLIKAMHEKGIPVISEIEFAGRYCTAKTICITGSNGKTTTTTLIYNIFKEAGFSVGLGGNIGESFALSVATAHYDWYVLELSSFQLDGMIDFRADVAVLMNITPDHQDRYDYKLQNYADSKFRIVQNQRLGDTFIYCADDPITRENLPQHTFPMNRYPFSLNEKQEQGAWLDEGMIRARVGERKFSLEAERLQILGRHNLYNAMAAIEAALAAEVPPRSIQRALLSFEGVEHRLEPCGEIKGVLYVNDSKATNVDSVWYALEAMNRPVIWIAGGTDKGNDYSQLDEMVTKKVKRIICMGIDNSKLLAHFGEMVPEMADTHSLEEALSTAAYSAESGDVVLLSPACASFDLFKNYEDRGRQFKNWVKNR